MPRKKNLNDIFQSVEDQHDFYQEVTTCLFEGMVVPSFLVLCRILNIEEGSHGNVRTRNKERLNCFFEYSRIESSHCIKIEKIYPFDVVKENIHQYSSPTSNGKTKSSDHTPRFSYQKYMLPLLQDFAVTELNPYYITYTSVQIYSMFGFTNKNVQKLSDIVQKISIEHDYNSKMKYPVVFTALKTTIGSNIILDLLKSLKKKNIIEDYGKITYIKYSDTDIRAASSDQLIKIEHARNEVIEKIKSGEYKKPCDYTLTERFISRLANIELKKEYQYETCGMRFFIKFNKDKFTPQLLSDVQKTEYQLILNSKLKERMLISLTKTANNIIDRVNEAEKEISDLTDEKKIQAKQKYIKTLRTRYNLLGKNPDNLLKTFLTVSDQYTDIELQSTEEIEFPIYDYSEYDDFIPNYHEY